jgi:hypothetical protein
MHADRALLEQIAARDMAQADLYFFARWMFLRRKGYTWQRAGHHRAICDALMRVYRGECSRLIINIPPRYSKTELAVINFVAWSLGQAPDCAKAGLAMASPRAAARRLIRCIWAVLQVRRVLAIPRRSKLRVPFAVSCPIERR